MLGPRRWTCIEPARVFARLMRSVRCIGSYTQSHDGALEIHRSHAYAPAEKPHKSQQNRIIET
jgi:hypothetical protein